MQLYLLISDQQHGPYAVEDVQTWLGAGQISPTTQAWHEGLSEWQPVASLIQALAAPPSAPPLPPQQETPPSSGNPLDSFQPLTQADRPATASVRQKAQGLLTPSEQIIAVAAQHLPGLSHEGVVVTNRRLLLIRPKLGGLKLSFEDWAWIDVVNVHIEEGILGSTFRVTAGGRYSQIERLDKEETRALYRLAQQLEEAARTGRRVHDLESLRAGTAVFRR